MTTEITEILERLHACEVGIEVQRGYLKAMEYALRVSFMTHQDSAELLDTWTRLLPPITRSHEDDGSPVFTAAFQQSLVVLTVQIGAQRRP